MIKLLQGNKECRFFSNSVKIKKREDGTNSRHITGYGGVYNSTSRKMGWFKEKIAPGAFDNADMSDTKAFFNHDENFILARTLAKTLILTPDSFGLMYGFDAPNTTAGNDLVENVALGNIQHSSFAFAVRKDQWEVLDNDPDGAEEMRTILDFSVIYDVSPVVDPTYLDTEVALRNFSEGRILRRKPIIVPMYNRNIAELELGLRKRR